MYVCTYAYVCMPTKSTNIFAGKWMLYIEYVCVWRIEFSNLWNRLVLDGTDWSAEPCPAGKPLPSCATENPWQRTLIWSSWPRKKDHVKWMHSLYLCLSLCCNEPLLHSLFQLMNSLRGYCGWCRGNSMASSWAVHTKFVHDASAWGKDIEKSGGGKLKHLELRRDEEFQRIPGWWRQSSVLIRIPRILLIISVTCVFTPDAWLCFEQGSFGNREHLSWMFEFWPCCCLDVFNISWLYLAQQLCVVMLEGLCAFALWPSQGCNQRLHTYAYNVRLRDLQTIDCNSGYLKNLWFVPHIDVWGFCF